MGGGLTPDHFPKLVFSKSADKWGWGSFEGHLGDGHTSVLPQDVARNSVES